ncbi:MAG: retention module-containing protein, partial [Proteobacteria bacterium]|nr:retention module-containing protein [Pseudomonadota bacterium]
MSTQIAEVQNIQGTAYAVDAEGNRRLLKAGDALFDGETVETSDGGVVELRLNDGQPFTLAGQPVFLISADLIAELAPNAEESALQAQTLDELLAEGSLESLEDVIESAEAEGDEALDDLLAAAEDDPTASGIDFDNLDATAAGGSDEGGDGGGSTIVQATRIVSSGDDTSALSIEGNTDAGNDVENTGGETNGIPVAVADAFLIPEDTAAQGNLADNDTLLGGEVFALVDGQGPNNGTLTLNEDGTFIFTPNADFVGEDSFQYVITDPSGDTSVATVSLTVEAVNDAPNALDDVITAQEDTLLEGINVLANDTDADGNLLTVVDAVSASGGLVTFNEDGTLNYQAPAEFTGVDTITYTIDDGAGGTSTATVTVTVEPINDAPIAADDQITVQEDTLLEGINVLANDSDIDSNALSITSAVSASGATVTVNADSTLNYQAPAEFTGVDT